MKNEVCLWGVKKGDPAWAETLLSTNPDRFEEIRGLASKDGYWKFRTATIDMTKLPDFGATLNKRTKGK